VAKIRSIMGATSAKRADHDGKVMIGALTVGRGLANHLVHPVAAGDLDQFAAQRGRRRISQRAVEGALLPMGGAAAPYTFH